MENGPYRQTFNPRPQHPLNLPPIRRNSRGILGPPRPVRRTIPMMRVPPRTIPGVFYRNPSPGPTMLPNNGLNTTPQSTAGHYAVRFPIQWGYPTFSSPPSAASQPMPSFNPHQQNIRVTQSPSAANLSLNFFYVVMPNGDYITIDLPAPQLISTDHPPFVLIPQSSISNMSHAQNTPTCVYFGPEGTCPYCPQQPQIDQAQQATH